MRCVAVLLVCLVCVGCNSGSGRRGGPKISEEEWKTKVLQSSEPVVVDFWATWCGPCQKMTPVIEALSKDYKVQKVNFDTNSELLERYDVHGIPAILIFKDGKEVKRHVGYTSESTLRKDLQNLSTQ